MSAEEKQITPRDWNRRKFIAFGALGLFGAGVYGIQRWISGSPKDHGARAPLRSALEFNERVNAGLKDHDHLVKEFPRERAVKQPKVNGREGLKKPIDLRSYTLEVNTGRGGDPLHIGMNEIMALPKTEIVFDFKCIEGWSQITHWGGVRFKDFAERYGVGSRSGRAPSNEDREDLFNYMGLRTPDGQYYVGIDMHSALHPQTILAYEINGAPLPAGQGAPLRLIIPTKYGVKNLKRIGTMFFSDERPPDYWFERGYDYDCAL
jgi:DMSO/TMAO reductase YedYZ molybdopterin-dependent catalytic subunit